MIAWQERIVLDPEVLAGKPVVRGTRLAVEFIITRLPDVRELLFRLAKESRQIPG